MDDGITRMKPRQSLFVKFEFAFSDLELDTKVPFVRYWVILSNLGHLRIIPHNEGHLVKVFVHNDAHCKTISRNFNPDPSEGININLVGRQISIFLET